MILTDTGPLVALADRNDPNHARCVAATKHMAAESMVTTWPCFTEAMYLVHRAGGYLGQETLWRMRGTGRLVLHELSSNEIDRMAVLMNKYRDTPMDLADASMVASAEQLTMQRVFTLDSDFHIYRLADGTALTLIP